MQLVTKKRRRAMIAGMGMTLTVVCANIPASAALADGDAVLSPNVVTMLQKAAARDGGVNLQAVTLIAIEADPAKAPSILAEVAKIAPDREPAIRQAAASVFPDVTLVTATPEPKKTPSLLSVDGWKGSLEVAGNRSTGNTDQTTAAVLGKAVHQTDTWTHKLNALFDFERTDDSTSKKRWLLGYDINYDLSNHTYLFGSFQYENDRFAQLDYRVTEAAGFGYRIIRRDDLTFNLEAGPAARQTRYLTGDKDSEVTGLVRTSFAWNLSDKSAITHDLVYVYSTDEQTVDTTAALKLRIIGALSGQFSYNYRYNSAPPLGTFKVDTVSRAGIVYDF